MEARTTKAAMVDNSLATVCAAVGVSEEGQALLEDGLGSEPYIKALKEAGMLADVVRVMTAVLPPREGIWWAWMSVRGVAGENAEPPVATALTAIERWLRDPSDPNRRAAFAAGEAADLATPVGCIAMATFFSGGSIAPPDIDPVPPPPFVANKTLAASILLAAVAAEPEEADEKLTKFIEQGMHVARRVGIWAS